MFEKSTISVTITGGHVIEKFFLRGYRAEKDTAPSHRVAAPERIPQKVELLFRQLADPRLLFVPDHCGCDVAMTPI